MPTTNGVYLYRELIRDMQDIVQRAEKGDVSAQNLGYGLGEW